MAERNFWTIKDGKIAKGQINFKWEPGTSTVQNRRSCVHLHHAIDFFYNLQSLDISSASTTELGISLSAFNLKWRGKTVECWYQGSKVYSTAGAMHHLYNATSMEAKKSMKQDGIGHLVGFNLEGQEFPMEPRTVFYDWIYLQGLLETYGDSLDLSNYTAFTDVKAVVDIDACQARTVCEYKLLQESNQLSILSDFDRFVQWHRDHVEVPYEFEISSIWIKYESDGVVRCNENCLNQLEFMCRYNGLSIEHLGYSRYRLSSRKPMVIDKSYCVIYTDMFLDDMVAIEELSRRYDKLYLVAVREWDLVNNDYASEDLNNLDDVFSFVRKWFKDVIITIKSISDNHDTVDGADCYLLANATKIVRDLEHGIKFNNITAMIGDTHDKDLNTTEWNASQDVEAYCKLLDYSIEQITSNDCRDRFNKRKYGSGDYYFLPEYIKRMQAIHDEVVCFDLQAVLPL